MSEQSEEYVAAAPINDIDLENEEKAWRPTLNDPAQAWEKYVEKLQERITTLEIALLEKPGAEARGVAWMDVFGTKIDPGTGRRLVVKISLTSRSNVDTMHALESLVQAVKHAQQRGFRPYNA